MHPPARVRAIAILVALALSLGAGIAWACVHAARLARDAPLAAVCAAATGRSRADLDEAYRALGVTSVETFPGDPRRRTYATLVTPLQSFACLVEVDAETVRSAHVFRITYAESTRIFEVPRWMPPWVDAAAQPLRFALGSLGALLTP